MLSAAFGSPALVAARYAITGDCAFGQARRVLEGDPVPLGDAIAMVGRAGVADA
jgi:hypothetical protein